MQRQPLEVWEIRCRPLGPGTGVKVWSIRAVHAGHAVGLFIEAGWDDADVLSVIRAPSHELDS